MKNAIIFLISLLTTSVADELKCNFCNDPIISNIGFQTV